MRIYDGDAIMAKSVLIVDDSAVIRNSLCFLLETEGFDVQSASNGIEGLEKVEARHFDAIIADINMPRMHGYDLLREIRYVPAYAELPVVVVSSRSGQKHQDQARALGATDYLTKPFSPESLAAVLSKWGRRG